MTGFSKFANYRLFLCRIRSNLKSKIYGTHVAARVMLEALTEKKVFRKSISVGRASVAKAILVPITDSVPSSKLNVFLFIQFSKNYHFNA